MDNVYKLCNFAILNAILISLFSFVKKKKKVGQASGTNSVHVPAVQTRGGDLEKDPHRRREGITDMM